MTSAVFLIGSLIAVAFAVPVTAAELGAERDSLPLYSIRLVAEQTRTISLSGWRN